MLCKSLKHLVRQRRKGPFRLPEYQAQKSKAHCQNVIPGTKY